MSLLDLLTILYVYNLCNVSRHCRLFDTGALAIAMVGVPSGHIFASLLAVRANISFLNHSPATKISCYN